MKFEEISDLFVRVEADLKKKAQMQAEREAYFESVTPIPQTCLIAWIDLLGFSQQLRDANTVEKFSAAYQKMLTVHREFDKETASADPDQKRFNEAQGKRIIALSDGLVIALDLSPDNPMLAASSIYETIGSFLESLRIAQARCAAAGNFLRGGIALGDFWFQDDVLLSPALAKAYEYESKKASHPVIVIGID